MASCCPSSGLHWPWLPAYLRSCSSHHLVFLLSSLPLLLLFSSWRAPLMLPCCPFWRCPVIACPSFVLLVVLLVCSSCFPVPILLCLLSSSCPPLVFLLSCCCRAAYVALQSRGWGCGRPQQQQQQSLPTKLFGPQAGVLNELVLQILQS